MVVLMCPPMRPAVIRAVGSIPDPTSNECSVICLGGDLARPGPGPADRGAAGAVRGAARRRPGHRPRGSGQRRALRPVGRPAGLVAIAARAEVAAGGVRQAAGRLHRPSTGPCRRPIGTPHPQGCPADRAVMDGLASLRRSAQIEDLDALADIVESPHSTRLRGARHGRPTNRADPTWRWLGAAARSGAAGRLGGRHHRRDRLANPTNCRGGDAPGAPASSGESSGSWLAQPSATPAPSKSRLP
jgi:hypothetical protein